jgi:hypothetical protein
VRQAVVQEEEDDPAGWVTKGERRHAGKQAVVRDTVRMYWWSNGQRLEGVWMLTGQRLGRRVDADWNAYGC